MTTPTTSAAPPVPTAARRYTQQIHALVDEPTREWVLGLASLSADTTGANMPKEGETIRSILALAAIRAHEQDPAAYAQARAYGRAELARRSELAAVRRAGRAAATA